jgi:hypothetical protein
MNENVAQKPQEIELSINSTAILDCRGWAERRRPQRAYSSHCVQVIAKSTSIGDFYEEAI